MRIAEVTDVTAGAPSSLASFRVLPRTLATLTEHAAKREGGRRQGGLTERVEEGSAAEVGTR